MSQSNTTHTTVVESGRMQYATERLVPISLFGPSAHVAAGVAGSIVRLSSISNEYFIYPRWSCSSAGHNLDR